MKKTMAAALLIVGSISVDAKMQMRSEKEFTTMCLKSFTQADSSLSLMDCDSSNNNKYEKLKLAKNGCAEGQASIRVLKTQVLSACLPSGMVQL